MSINKYIQDIYIYIYAPTSMYTYIHTKTRNISTNAHPHKSQYQSIHPQHLIVCLQVEKSVGKGFIVILWTFCHHIDFKIHTIYMYLRACIHTYIHLHATFPQIYIHKSQNLSIHPQHLYFHSYFKASTVCKVSV